MNSAPVWSCAWLVTFMELQALAKDMRVAQQKSVCICTELLATTTLINKAGDGSFWSPEDKKHNTASIWLKSLTLTIQGGLTHSA